MPVVPLGLRLVPTYLGPGGATAANVLHFLDVGGDFDQATMDSLIDAWASFWSAQAGQDWSIDSSAEALDLSDDPPDSIIASFAGETGDIAQEAFPPAVSVVVSLRAATGGRRGRGRFYLPGIPETVANQAGQIDATYISDLLTDYIAFATAAGTLGWAPAVYSRSDGFVRVVNSFGVDGILDTQRNRQGRLA